ncbi:MAG: CopG family transcriptional regulator [Geobacteraceae bacterium]|nr:CopG family transcriptional regulator [Geobacteraceae bacterium]
MGRYKQNPRYNVVSIRISDEEKALLDKLRKVDRSSITALIRKAITNYTTFSEVSVNNG